MPFEIVRNDICKMKADAIVNTANPRPVVGSGTDAMIHHAAGPELLRARLEIGHIAPGDARITPAFGLQAKYVIHAVGPAWQGGGQNEAALLRSCYDRALALARERGCRSIAFPLICAGNYGFPRDKALQIAIAAFSQFLPEHEMQIYLVVFDRDSYRLSEKLFRGVASYIDEHYVQTARLEAPCPRMANYREYAPVESMVLERKVPAKRIPSDSPMPAPRTKSLKELLKKMDAGFTETLLKRIDQSGKKDSEIYKKANLSKQHFSKIRNNPDYKPTKATALALAIALELDLEQTRDLIGRAGYALTDSSKFDLIIRYFIEQGNYNIIEINLALYEFDQSLLGA